MFIQTINMDNGLMPINMTNAEMVHVDSCSMTNVMMSATPWLLATRAYACKERLVKQVIFCHEGWVTEAMVITCTGCLFFPIWAVFIDVRASVSVSDVDDVLRRIESTFVFGEVMTKSKRVVVGWK